MKKSAPEDAPENPVFRFHVPENSEWQCHMFGHPNGITYTPLKGEEPNAWHRFWQRVILGHLWVKRS